MESVQETFILQTLDNYNVHNELKIYNLDELSYYLSMLLNKDSSTGFDMKAVFYLFNTLFSIGLKK